MQVYRLRIGPERAPKVARVFDFSARHTLYDVHRAIVRGFELDDDHLHAFYMSGKHWDRPSEISGPDSPGGSTDQVRLHQLGLEPGKRFSYVLDFGAELWYALEVEGVGATEAAPHEPELVESLGDPAQYPVDDEQELPDVSAILPLAEELIALFPHDANDGAEADGREHAVDDAQDADEESPTEDVDTEDVDTEDVDTEDVDTEDADTEDADTWLEHSALELEPAALSAALDVATRLARALEGDSERLLALEEITHSDLLAMLADLPLALAQAGRVEDGVELGRVLAFLDPPYFGSERARLLANAGRHDEALAQLVQNLQAPTRDGWVEVEAADVYAQLGDAARAEALLQSVVERSREAQVRDVAFDRLLELLDSQGRHREVKAMLSAERARLDDLVKPTPRTVQNVTPKVGRNDPCPCGSGKKHKKCCLV